VAAWDGSAKAYRAYSGSRVWPGTPTLVEVIHPGFDALRRTVSSAGSLTWGNWSLRRPDEPFLRFQGEVVPLAVDRHRILIVLGSGESGELTREEALRRLAPTLERLRLVPSPPATTPREPPERCESPGGEQLVYARRDGRPFSASDNALAVLRRHRLVRTAGPLLVAQHPPFAALDHVIDLFTPGAIRPELADFMKRHDLSLDEYGRVIRLPAAMGLGAVDIANAVEQLAPELAPLLRSGPVSICH
jgi:hypothetical protein